MTVKPVADFQLWLSDKIDMPGKPEFAHFLQQLANRRLQGHCRYGAPRRDRRYMSRLAAELKAYRKTGNLEHLLNIAVYANLESIAPENPKFHFDPRAKSVTRGKYGA